MKKGQEGKLLCAFANPLEIDNHNMTEGGTLLEGKYWKRQMETVTTEYIRWRMFYKNRSNSGAGGERPNGNMAGRSGEELTDEVKKDKRGGLMKTHNTLYTV